MTGYVMYGKEGEPGLPNFVVVEGGPRAMKRYKKLLLRRVKWTTTDPDSSPDPQSSQEDEPEEQKTPQTAKVPTKGCYLVWEGMTKKR